MGRRRESAPAFLISVLAHGHRGATAPISISRAPACAAESPKLSLPGAAPGRLANLSWGCGRQAMHLLCKQDDVGALPTDSTNFNRGENKIQASLISSASVGATPTPATTVCTGPPREVIRLPDCKLLAQGHQCRKNKVGSDELERYPVAVRKDLPTISDS